MRAPAAGTMTALNSKTCAACQIKNCQTLIEVGFKLNTVSVVLNFPVLWQAAWKNGIPLNYVVSVLDNLE